MLETIIIVVLISMGLVIVRAVLGPTTYDRILAVNTFGTKTVIFIVLLGVLAGDMMFLDIALIYVLINFITTIGFLKYFKYRSFGRE